MRSKQSGPNFERPPRQLNVVRIKLVVVSLGAGLAALISSFTGITPQVSFAPMIGWMLGFSPAKSQASAMRVTAATAIACVAGAVWRSSLRAIVSPGADARLSQINVAHAAPSVFFQSVAAIFVGATAGAVLSVKAVPRPGMIALRRAFLFLGVCIGIYVASEGSHYSSLTGNTNPRFQGAIALLLLGFVSGALTQVSGLASGIILVPLLYFAAGLTIQQSILVSLTVVGLAAMLPAWSYHRRGLGDLQYSAAGMIGGIAIGFVGGAILVSISTRLLLLLFALMSMFFSAREISILALELPKSSTPSGPDLN